MKHKTEESRRSWRFPKSLKALYFIQEKKSKGKDCTIINISLNGAGLDLYTVDPISAKTKLILEILPADGKETVTIEGIVQWVKQERTHFICGIKLTEKLNKGKLKMLRV